MQIATVGSYPLTLGWVIALLALLIAILGLISVIPLTPTVAFGLFAALAVSRLV